ncbi:MAG: hypothetical protein ACFFED_07140 [Candidatus Thorarchaeota archaeon]
MTTLEDFLVRNMAIFSGLGLALRFLMYGLPLLQLVWLYVVLSFLVGMGGAALAVGREYSRRNYSIIGIVLVIIGLLPFQNLFPVI